MCRHVMCFRCFLSRRLSSIWRTATRS
uniref:Uncharacterized protein n=1 Tax=Arundo donax TaxID=35708 RepID=A0A0A9F6Y5_ARUDO